MLKSTLYVSDAGFGTLLHQINAFFHLSDTFSFDPRVSLARVKKRNSLNSSEFFHEIGLSEVISQEIEEEQSESISLSRISSNFSEAYFFDSRCYKDSDLKRVLGGRLKRAHPKLCKLATQSNLYFKICNHSGVKSDIAVHVRRGDVAQIKADDFPDIFDLSVAAGKTFHWLGVFDKESLRSEIPEAYFNRFVSTRAHLEVLNLVKEQKSINAHTLVSDGFTKISQRIIARHPDLLLDRNISVQNLEKDLESELYPLSGGANETKIGECDSKFYDAVTSVLSSKIVISASPGFLWQLSRFFEFDTQFISPKSRPQE